MSEVRKNNVKEIDGYELINPLPRWAYCDSEYADMAISSDKIIDGLFYVKIKPEPRTQSDLFLERMINGE